MSREVPMIKYVLPALRVNDEELRKAVKKYYLGTLRKRDT